MNKILLFFMLLCFEISFAQLSVRNNAYVYVNDLVLYVEDDVNIEESTAHVYLRNESQLIQGSGTTGNSGVGKLSIYQNGKASAAAYNYWCSPVGNVLGDDNNNRPFRANNNIYDVVSSPITSNLATYMQAPNYNGTTAPLVIADYWLWSYNPGTQYSEWDHVLSTGDVASGYGFTMKGTLGSSNNQLYDFRGKPNNGTIFTSVLNGQETLVGNPYPSALDARDYIHDSNNASLLDSGTLYFWEQDLTITSHVIINYRGGYATYTINSAGTVETFIPATFDSYNYDGTLNTGGSSSTSGKAVFRYIPVGQGFMVKGSGSGNLRTTNSMRKFEKEAPNVSEFFRQQQNNSRTDYIQYNDEGLQVVPDDYKRFRINVDFNDTYTRQLLQNFHHTASAEKDYGLESKSPELIESDAHWIQDGEAYSAQAFNFNVDLTIPLHVIIENQQLVRFRIFDVQNFDDSQPIFIHDIENDLYVDLRSQNYELNLEPGNYTNRFEITFTSNALSTEDVTILDDFSVFQNNNLSELHILNPNQIEIKSVNLFDANGKQIFNKIDLPIDSSYMYSTKGLSNGVYIVKITFDSGQDLSKKIIIANKQ
ncbi:T9SS type A sorting domain-containing protein [Hanstruepera ponticola]|uniref:T9SS type A sorting domain-containing protein n=1 Tax=Hanstruepera ponticola TaxID=2042995 RepID=UPI000CF1A3CE|nr:T9SS type A sorting domain-containing protein [Hanstruepera ponticola]